MTSSVKRMCGMVTSSTKVALRSLYVVLTVWRTWASYQLELDVHKTEFAKQAGNLALSCESIHYIPFV